MVSLVRRPTSVWAAQIVLFVFGLIFLAPLAVTLPAIFRGSPDASPARLVLVAAANVAIVAAIGVAIWGMFRRRSYGRWLGIASLAVMMAMTIWGQFYASPDASDEATRSAGSLWFAALLAFFLLLLIVNLAFTRQAAAFFAAGVQSEPAAD